MEAEYIYYIIIGIIIGGIALYAIHRFRSVEGKIKLPGGIEVEGKGTEETPAAIAETEVEGHVEDTKMETSSNAGPAITKIKGDVKGSDLTTKVDKG